MRGAVREDEPMATETAGQTDLDQPDPTEEEREPEHSKSGFRSRQLKMLVLLVVVMAAEAAGFYLLIPPPAPAEKEGSTPSAMADEAAMVGQSRLESDTVEVPIGTFNCTNSRANPGAVNHVTFSLAAVVAADQAARLDRRVNKQHKARIRQAVIKVVRSANLEDLDDPNLSAIRRLIREEINKVLQQSMVNEIVISEFTRMEQ